MALLTRTQEGYWDGGAWQEAGTLQVNEPGGRYAAWLFSGAILGESRLLAATLTLSAFVIVNQPPVRLSIYARAGAVSPLWGAGNPPPALASLSPVQAFLVGEATLTALGSQDVVIPLDLPGLDAARTIGYSPATPWDGQFALHAHAFTANGTALLLGEDVATLDLTQTTRVFTGIEIGLPLSKYSNSRPDICPICGEESLRETWIWCALRNRLECPRCGIDPDDIPRRYGPSQNRLINDEG